MPKQTSSIRISKEAFTACDQVSPVTPELSTDIARFLTLLSGQPEADALAYA